MTTFDNRDKGFENKYAHDEETNFRINALRTRLLGFWAAKKIGKPDAACEQYARQLIEETINSRGDAILIEKLETEFAKHSTPVTTKEIRSEMEKLLANARKQIMGEAK